ncbi:MAPEG family protein [Kordiimonas marina]|uniref:MAPEG family protein n=1 Tax=Kordiimonas marina TaxID=2872312 RepID=UPI001FF0F8A0|nr:MAPEG family protein [Kordiimonas marina]MCJ9429125.1 MAPEG family protein [Kordiimonas marina]
MDKAILYPMAALAALTFGVALVLVKRRFAAVKAGETTNLKYFKTFQGEGEPEYVRVAQRNMINLFETPILFYVGCLAAAVFGAADTVSVASAWAYVAIRLLHTIVHITVNKVPWRANLFFLSFVPLIVLWVNVVA